VADVERIVAALTTKMRGLPRAGYTDDEWLAAVVGTVVADTALIVEGQIAVERYEASDG
jgi:hypothetical protein